MKLAPALSFLVLLVASALGRGGQDPLPQDEEKLYAHAREAYERWHYVEAVRAYQAFVGKFPSSGRAKDAMEQLASMHINQIHRPGEARLWYLRLCEKYPKAPEYWTWRLGVAHASALRGEKDRAIEEYRKVAGGATDGHLRAQAAHEAWKVQGKELTLTVHRSFTEGEQPVVHVRRRKMPEVRYRAFRVEYAALLPHLEEADDVGLSGLVERAGRGARTLLKEWIWKDGEPFREEEIAIPSRASGLYFLEAEHDGLAIEALATVGRFGLVAKSAEGKLLCFAQERATSRPVAGAEIRVLSGERPFRGFTDAQGLFVTEGFKGGTVLGMKDGEIFLLHASSDQAGEPTELIYVATDRPIYRPGHTVRFRLVHRDELGRELSIKPGRRFVVRIVDPRNNPVFRETVALNDFGSAEGSFRLGDSPTLGEHRISVHPEPKDEEEARRLEQGWWWSSRNFRVDEYRKPEFKVQVLFPNPSVVQGGKIEAAIQADYYFGGAVVEAEVHYRLFKARLSPWSWGWPYYYDWYSKDDQAFEEPTFFSPGSYLGEEAEGGDGRTDRDGKLAISLENPKGEHDFVYTVVASVTDLSRRQVEGLGSCKAPRAEFSLGMTLDKYVYRKGDRIGIKLRAVGHDEKPPGETKVVLRATERRWDREGEAADSLVYEGSSVTDANGAAHLAFTPEIAGGYLVLTAEARDRRGNVTSTEEWAWLAGPGDWYSPANLEGFSLALDKKAYDVGETAQILIQSPRKNVTLLVTIEGQKIHHRQVVALKGHAGLVEYRIDDPDLAPNSWIEAIAIRDGEILAGSKRLIVNPSRKFVNVEIKPDREEYRPRQKARYEIRTTGADGRPVAAEVAFGIVDESIYALQEEYEEDIRKFFIRSRWNDVSTWATLNAYQTSRGGPLTGATFALAGDEAKGQGAGRFAATEVRSKFADTMLWKVVRTDAEGRASVEVEIADNLTTWRATARAITADSRFGQERRSVVSRKNVIVRVETPRFLTQNDVSTLTAVVHNYLPAEKELRVEFSASGVEAQGEAVRAIRVPSGGQKRLDWKAVARDAGTARVTVKALGDVESDAMEVTLPILPHGSPRWDMRGGVAEGRVVEKVTLPADAIPGTAELLVAVSPVHASMVLDALDSLAGYPYGCVEQTMSRFLPSVIVAGTLKKLGLSRPKLEAELPAMISSGLQRLYSMQHEDGGWGWWERDESNPWMTGYVLAGLAMAREAGAAVSPDCLENAAKAARAMLGKGEDPNLQAYLLHALGEPREEAEFLWRDLLAETAGELKPYAQALLALALHRQKIDARPVLRALEKAAFFDRGRSHGWLDDGAEAAAAALRAFLAIDPKHPLVPKLVQGLGAKRRGPWWTSTRQTAMAVHALSEYLAQTGELNPDLTVSLAFNGKELYSERITRESWPKFDGVRRFSAAEIRPGENEIVIERKGKGSPTYTVALQYRAKGENFEASKGGLAVARAYHAISRRGDERVLTRVADGYTAVSGQEMEVTLTFTADKEYEWLMVEDPLPAGFEPVREYWGWYGWDWNYWYSSKEFHDDRVSIAIRELGPGTHAVSYTMRAETPGDYHALPARAFNMYFPEVGGNSAENRIKVVDGK